MADSQPKIDAAAEKAFAEAAEKKTAEATAKPVEAAKQAVSAAVEAAPKAAPAAAVKPVVKAASPKKAAIKKVVARKAPKKSAAKKPVVAKVPAKKPVARTAAKTVSRSTPITQLKEKIMATTKTTDFTATARDAVTGMQTRAKAAYEKTSEMTADMTAFHKGNFDAMVESGKVLAATMQDLGRTAVEDARTAAETATADVKKIVAVKSPTELFQLQGEIARRNLDTIVARTSKNAEVMMKLVNDMFAPISTRASVAMERLNKAA